MGARGPKPWKISASILKQVETLASSGVSARWACVCLGVSEDTFSRQRKRQPKLADAWDAGRRRWAQQFADAAPDVVAGLIKAAKGGDPGALAIFLEKVLHEEIRPAAPEAGQGSGVQVQIFLPENGRPRTIDALPTRPRLPEGG